MSTPTTVVSTFDGDAYFIVGRTPDQIQPLTKGNQFMRLPNGSYIASSSIKAISSYEDYKTALDVADHHKRREWLGKDGYWHSADGAMIERVDVERYLQRTDTLPAIADKTHGVQKVIEPRA